MSKNKNIDEIRHSLAHLLAAAILELYPDAKPTIGPAIDNGFYYDFEFPTDTPGEDDLPKIERKMEELLPSWKSFEKTDVNQKQAKEHFSDNPYKLELIDEITEKNEGLSFYKSGEFRDLCRGGHVENPSQEINTGAFKLSHIAGAYWRGLESNKMLTRIYGLAFETPKELRQYEEMLEEAKKRDHKKLGRDLDIFVFSELVGPGLPLWTPKGTLIRNLLDDFVWKLRKERGYEKVEIPHITKKDLYERSGHWEKFSDELFRIETREGHEFSMKPMNCPHHTQIYARKQHSYKDLPERYANTTMCYRDEQTGELNGILRTRAFTQDDAHVFCAEDQVKDEAFKIWDIVETFYKAFGFELKLRLSTHDPDNMDNYLGTIDKWEKAVSGFEDWLKERGADYYKEAGEAAFYGPKIDFIAVDSLGREWQVATIQVDRNMPERFDLTYINKEGEEERVVMLHAAIMGSIERFMAVLIEHTGGAFPLWLSPVQVKILPIGEDHHEYSKKILETLNNHEIRAEVDFSGETLGKKIRNLKLDKVPFYLVIGDKELESEMITVESRDDEDSQKVSVNEFIDKYFKD